MRANSAASGWLATRLAPSVARRKSIRRSSISCARAGSAAISARRLASVLNGMCGSSCDCSRPSRAGRSRVGDRSRLRTMRPGLAANVEPAGDDGAERGRGAELARQKGGLAQHLAQAGEAEDRVGDGGADHVAQRAGRGDQRDAAPACRPAVLALCRQTAPELDEQPDRQPDAAAGAKRHRAGAKRIALATGGPDVRSTVTGVVGENPWLACRLAFDRA